MAKTDAETIADAVAYNAKLGGSRFVQYGDLMIMIPLRDIRNSIQILQKGHGAAKRIMPSVNRALTKAYPRVVAGTATHDQAMKFGLDVAIWFANEVNEGRASLEEH